MIGNQLWLYYAVAERETHTMKNSGGRSNRGPPAGAGLHSEGTHKAYLYPPRHMPGTYCVPDPEGHKGSQDYTWAKSGGRQVESLEMISMA